MASRAVMSVVKPTAVVADQDRAARGEIAGLVTRLGCDVVEVRTGDEALEIAERETPSIVVLEVAPEDGSAYECCRALRERCGEGLLIVLIAQQRVDPADEVAGLLLGADEYLAKPVHPAVFTARMRRLLLRVQPRPLGQSPLTPREDEVLTLLASGVPAAEISTRLHIAPKTTATHIEHILAKIGAHSRAEAVALALRNRLVNPAA